MNVRLTTLLAAAFAIVVLALGCGGDDDSGSAGSAANGAGAGEGGTAQGEDQGGGSNSRDSGEEGEALTTSSLDKREFVKRASDACSREREDLIEEVEAFAKKHGEKDIPEDVLFTRMARQVMLPTIESEIDAVRKLGAPEGEEEEVEAILAAQQEAVEEARGQKASSYEDVEEHFVDATELYKAYGFTACMNSP